MFKSLSRKGGGKVREKFEFRFRFHATRVPPSGFDKLVVSLIPADTNKLEGQTQRASVKNGNCQWTDTLTEQVILTKDTKLNAYDSKFYRFVVSTGSTKSGVLGEAVLNIAEFGSFSQLDQRALPLKYCPAGSILHISIQCIPLQVGREDDSGEHTRTGQSGKGGALDDQDDERLSEGQGSDASGIEYKSLDSLSSHSHSLNATSSLRLNTHDGGHARRTFDAPEAALREQHNFGTSQTRAAGVPPQSLRPSSSADSLSESKPEHVTSGPQRLPSSDSFGTLPTSGKPQIPSIDVRTNSNVLERRRAWESASQGSQGSMHSSPSGTPKKTSADKQSKPEASPSGKSSYASSPDSGIAGTGTRGYNRGAGGARGAYYAPGAQPPILMGPILDNYSPVGPSRGKGNLHPATGPELNSSSRDLKADLAAAEAAIEELQSESVTWQRASRNLSKEVENLRSQLADAMKQDQAAEMEIATLAAERDALKEDLLRLQDIHRLTEAEQDGHAATQWEAANTKRSMGELQDEVMFQQDTVASFNARIQKLQEANEDLQLAAQEAEATVEQYKMDLEELFEKSKEWETAAKRSQLALEDKDKEWEARLKKVVDAYTEEPEAMAPGGAPRAISAEDKPVQAVDNEIVAELERKVDELEKEAQELTEESMQLAADLTQANKELDAKGAALSAKERELEEIRAQLQGGPPFVGGLPDKNGTKGVRPAAQGGAAGGVMAPASADEATGLSGVVSGLEQRLSEAEYRNGVAMEGDEVGELRSLRNKLRLAEMSAEQASERLNILETFERRSKKLEQEVEEKKEELEVATKERRMLIAQHEQELRKLEDRHAEDMERAEDEKVDAERKCALLAEQLDRSHRTVSELEGEKAAVMLKLKEHFSLRKQAEETASALAGEKMELAHKLEEVELLFEKADGRAKLLEDEAVKLRVENEQVRQAKDFLEQEASVDFRSSMERRLHDSEEQRGLAVSRVQELELQVSAMKELLDQAKAREAAQTNTHSDRQLEESREECRTAGRRIQELELQLRNFRTQFVSQSAMCRDLERQVDELKLGKASLEAQVLEAVQGKASLQGQIEKIQESLLVAEKELRDQTSAMREAEACVLELRGAVVELEHESQDAKAEKRNAIAKAIALEGQLEMVARESAMHADGKQDLKSVIAKMHEEAMANAQRREEVQNRLAELQDAHEGKVQKLHEVEAQLREASVRVKSLEGKLAGGQGNVGADAQTEMGSLLSRASAAEAACAKKTAELEQLQVEVESLRKQLESFGAGHGTGVAQALLEASKLRAERGEFVERLQKLQSEVVSAGAGKEKLAAELESTAEALRVERATARQRETSFKEQLAGSLATMVASQESASAVKRLREELMEKQRRVEELSTAIASQAHTNALLEVENQRLHSQLQVEQAALLARVAKAEGALEAADGLRARNAVLEGERASLAARAEDAQQLQDDNAILQQRCAQLQERLDQEAPRSGAQAGGGQAALLASEVASLRMSNNELKRRVAEKHLELEEYKGEMAKIVPGAKAPARKERGGIMSPRPVDGARQLDEMKRKMGALEAELQRKAEALARAERALQGTAAADGAVTSERPLSRSIGRSSKVGPLSTSPSKEGDEHREKLLQLEEREKTLSAKLQEMIAANEQLKRRMGSMDGPDPLHAEVFRLQNQNSQLVKRERELTSQLGAQEVLQDEIKRLQEANEKMQKRMQRFRTAGNGNLADRLAGLEMELAEALEDNNMYKEQLRNAFANKANVHSAAITNLGDADSIVAEMVSAKKAAKIAEEELNAMRSKYSELSLRVAEGEAQREELVMLLRAARNGVRRPPFRA